MIEPLHSSPNRAKSLFASALLLVASSLFASCSGGGGGGVSSSGAGGGMRILSCSLGCSNSAVNPGAQFSCGITDVFRNQEIRVTFSSAIDPNSVNNNTFRLTENGTGAVPAGLFSIDGADPRVLIFRPRISFNSSGQPIFGLRQGVTYDLRVPGTILDPLGPYIRNSQGQENTSRLQCTLAATLGVFDANPGAPALQVTVDKVIGTDGNGDPILATGVNAAGATDVFRNSAIRLSFDDVMNPATLANPVSGTSDTIDVLIDPDGNTNDASDQVPLQGSFTLTLDQTNNETIVVYRASAGLPSAGAGTVKRVIVLRVSSQISDLGGNPVSNPGEYVFTPEEILFAPLEVTEDFTSKQREDSIRTGAPWAENGLFKVGVGGGSGRLGEIFIPAGTTVVLNTDSEDFSSITNPAVFNPANIVDRTPGFLVEEGVFEFSRVRIDAGGVLRFVGSRAARVYVRGECVIQGLLDVSGEDSLLHDGFDPMGGIGGTAGAGGGFGGDGGMRPDGSAFFTESGVPNPAAGPTDVLDPATYVFVNGMEGTGVPTPSTLDPNPEFVGAGGGGLAWPQPTPQNTALHFPADPDDTSGVQWEPGALCNALAPGGAGSGGAHAFSGLDGTAFSVSSTIEDSLVELAPTTPGGNGTAITADPEVKTLAPNLGYLRGGAGGGGAGSHLFFSEIDGVPLGDCTVSAVNGGPARITKFLAHSGSGGGGGGGGVQVAAGRRLTLNGVISARGGDGGAPDPSLVPALDQTQDGALAQSGGGGAGGGVLLQSQEILIEAIPGRIDVRGGRGGRAPYFTTNSQRPSRGGNGSPGLLRLEANTPPVPANEAPNVLPNIADVREDFGAQHDLSSFFTSEVWNPVAVGVAARSGGQSCWIRPQGNFFRLGFQEDGAELGWDLNLIINGLANPQSYRGPNDLPGNETLEERFGSVLGSSPLVVRFQGARALGQLSQPCNTALTGVNSPIVAASVTDWVEHPAMLSNFHGNPALTPNIFRFSIFWDRSSPDLAGIEGVEDLRISILPD